jgi:hypothetical protein
MPRGIPKKKLTMAGMPRLKPGPKPAQAKAATRKPMQKTTAGKRKVKSAAAKLEEIRQVVASG